MSAQPQLTTARARTTRPGRRRLRGAALLASLVLLAGCADGAELADGAATAQPLASPSPATDQAASPAAPPTPTAPPSPTAQPTPEPAATPAVLNLGTRFDPQIEFSSPTGNLACSWWQAVTCRALEHTWISGAADPQTECAPTERFASVQINDGEVRELNTCYDPVDDPKFVLPYGQGIELDDVRCVSEQQGISCVRTLQRTGFAISRDELRRLPRDSPLLRSPAGTPERDGTVTYPPGVQVAFLAEDRLANCVLRADGAFCDVQTTATAPPADPCELELVLSAVLRADEPGRLSYECTGDASPGMDELRRGESIQVGDLRCTAGVDQLRCAYLTGSQHGFEIDRTSFRGF